VTADFSGPSELRSRHDATIVAFLDAFALGARWYTAMRDYQRAEAALDSARWYAACESYQWCRRDLVVEWSILVQWRALRFAYGCSYHSPGRELVLRRENGVSW